MKINSTSTGLLVVISAPSGTGKTSILSEITKQYPDIRFSVSVTTRQPRKSEKDGVNYIFVTDEEFDALVEKNEFIEWALVYGNRYGTLKSTIEDVLKNGQILLLDTDTVGAFNIKKQFSDRENTDNDDDKVYAISQLLDSKGKTTHPAKAQFIYPHCGNGQPQNGGKQSLYETSMGKAGERRESADHENKILSRAEVDRQFGKNRCKENQQEDG